MLPLFVYSEEASKPELKYDLNNDGIINRTDWRRMKQEDKETFVRMSLEAIDESPDVAVFKDKNREELLLETFEAIYGR